MPWFPDLARPAFCETVQLRKMILERKQLSGLSPCHVLEPSSAEFIAALAAGNNCQNILQIGCGLSTIALAAATRVTGGCFISVHTDREKQEIVRHHMQYLGLLEFVGFIVNEPCNVVPKREDVDFAFFTGDPKEYIKLFDLVNLKNGAIVAADNALSEASNDYIRHVRRQPGVDSSTLPLARGIEVTKIVSWDIFQSGRILHSGSDFNDGIEERTNGLPRQSLMSSCTATTSGTTDGNNLLSCDEQVKVAHHSQMNASYSADVLKDEPAADLNHAGLKLTDRKDSMLDLSSIGEVSQVRPRDGSDFEHDSEENAFSNCGKGKSQERVNAQITRHLEDETSPLSVTTVQETITSSTNSSKANAHAAPPLDDFSVSHDLQTVHSPDLHTAGECPSNFEVHFKNHDAQTEVSVTGIDRDMLLTDITLAFNDMGVSVRTANISTTQERFVEDIFHVVDARTGAPLHPCQWNAIKDRILQRIGNRSGAPETLNP